MSWSGEWSQPDPRDTLTRDEVLAKWEASKQALQTAKDDEMSWRKYAFSKAFPDATEGMNTFDLGNGQELKGGKKLNYNLDADLDKVEAALDKIATMGNEGSFLAERLVKWEASFLLTEYRKLQADDVTDIQKAIKKEIDSVLTITDAAPTLEIKKSKKK